VNCRITWARYRFGGAQVIDELSQRDVVVLEIITHAVQPFGLRMSYQSLRGKGGFTGAVTCQRLQRLVALARLGQLDGRVRAHGFEHLI